MKLYLIFSELTNAGFLNLPFARLNCTGQVKDQSNKEQKNIHHKDSEKHNPFKETKIPEKEETQQEESVTEQQRKDAFTERVHLVQKPYQDDL